MKMRFRLSSPTPLPRTTSIIGNFLPCPTAQLGRKDTSQSTGCLLKTDRGEKLRGRGGDGERYPIMAIVPKLSWLTSNDTKGDQ